MTVWLTCSPTRHERLFHHFRFVRANAVKRSFEEKDKKGIFPLSSLVSRGGNGYFL